MTDVPFIYVHCDVPAGRPLRAARSREPRERFVARLVAKIGRGRVAFYPPVRRLPR